jgi:hypothetical protein
VTEASKYRLSELGQTKIGVWSGDCARFFFNAMGQRELVRWGAAETAICVNDFWVITAYVPAEMLPKIPEGIHRNLKTYWLSDTMWYEILCQRRRYRGIAVLQALRCAEQKR